MIERTVMRSGRSLLAATVLASAAMLAVVPARADDAVTLSLTIKDRRFDPAELHAPPGKAITLQVKNLSSIACETTGRGTRGRLSISFLHRVLRRWTLRPQRLDI